MRDAISRIKRYLRNGLKFLLIPEKSPKINRYLIFQRPHLHPLEIFRMFFKGLFLMTISLFPLALTAEAHHVR